MYQLKFTTKYGKAVTLDNYKTKEQAARHGKLLQRCQEIDKYEIVDITSNVSDTKLSNTKDGEFKNGL